MCQSYQKVKLSHFVTLKNNAIAIKWWSLLAKNTKKCLSEEKRLVGLTLHISIVFQVLKSSSNSTFDGTLLTHKIMKHKIQTTSDLAKLFMVYGGLI